jgi:hypothetical protein
MDAMWQAIIASAVGVIFTVAARFIDRILPDPQGKHPIPPPPAQQAAPEH